MAINSLGPNIHITGFSQPEGPGATIAWRCPECGVTNIAWNEYAVRPSDGGAFFVITMECMQHVKFLRLDFPARPTFNFTFTGWHLPGETDGV